MYYVYYFKQGRPLIATFEDRDDAEFFCRSTEGQAVELVDGEYIEILDSTHR